MYLFGELVIQIKCTVPGTCLVNWFSTVDGTVLWKILCTTRLKFGRIFDKFEAWVSTKRKQLLFYLFALLYQVLN
jgi:hypothetical protein